MVSSVKPLATIGRDAVVDNPSDADYASVKPLATSVWPNRTRTSTALRSRSTRHRSNYTVLPTPYQKFARGLGDKWPLDVDNRGVIYKVKFSLANLRSSTALLSRSTRNRSNYPLGEPRRAQCEPKSQSVICCPAYGHSL